MTKLLVIDTETGGLDPTTHAILTLAGVVWQDKQIVDSFEVKIWEGDDLHVTPTAMAINKIDLKELKETGLTPRAAFTEFMDFVAQHFDLTKYNDAILVGHNVGFDKGFFKRLCELSKQEWPKVFGHRTLDTASVLQFLIIAVALPLRAPNSKDAFELFGVTPENAHTALGDATATANMLTKLVELVAEPVPNA